MNGIQMNDKTTAMHALTSTSLSQIIPNNWLSIQCIAGYNFRQQYYFFVANKTKSLTQSYTFSE